MNSLVERITEHTYRLPFGDGGEVWGRRTGLNSHDETSVRFASLIIQVLRFPIEVLSEEQIIKGLGASFDVNRPLSGKAEQFLDRLTVWAQQEKLPSPFLQPVARSVKLDWPGLSEKDIPRTMQVIANILGR